MKRKQDWFRMFALALVLAMAACNPVNRTDIERLLSPAALPYLKPSKMMMVSSFDSTGGNNDRVTIAPGKKATILNVDGPGMITRIWMTIDSRDPYFLRRIVIRMYWDDEEKPSVEVPVGDFFGNGFNYRHYTSQYLGMTSGGYVCYFPMPFEESARIEISNETNQEVYALYYQISYQKFETALDREVGYFHAYWNRNIRTNYDSNYVLLNATGKGHIVGVNMNMQSYEGNLGFLEGDEMVFVDGEKRPSIHGTGTEDYFSSGWYFSTGEFAGPYNGLIYKNDTMGRIAAYRLHVVDPIPFKKSIKFTMEHGHGNTEIADYASTIYWYQTEPHKPFPAFPKAGQRIPLRIVKPSRMLEAEKLKFNLGGLKSKVADMSEWGPEWGENRQIVIEAREKSNFDLTINGLRELTYNLDIYYSKGPDYGNAELYVNGIKAGEVKGYSPYILPDGKVSLKDLKNSGHSLDIRFVVTGKDPNSKGYLVGLDGISLVPHRDFIPGWYVLGPFANPRGKETDRRGLDSVYMPERKADTSLEYSGLRGKPIRWEYVQTPDNGYFSLVNLVRPSELVVTYAMTWVYSPDNRKVSLFIGTDDGAKVFFNGKEVYRFLDVRVAEPDQAEIELNMKQGWNQLLLKIENNLGGYGFYARFLDKDKILKVSAAKSVEAPVK
jgi:hypothetical protein